MTQHLTHGGLPDGMTRWQFFGLIKRARRQLGLSKGAIGYLKVAISNTMDEDFLAGRICSFWTSVTKIAAQAEMDRRQVARIEGDLIQRGLLAKTASDHSRRGGSRRDGRIGHEFGINLAPLIARVAEIQAAARMATFEEEGGSRAALCLLVADHNAGRSDKYRVRDTAAAFISMVRSEARQSAVLDRLLGELIAFAKGERHD